MTAPELKPCPFCGRKAEYKIAFGVICKSCKACLPCTNDEAAAAWNTRTDTLPAMIARAMGEAAKVADAQPDEDFDEYDLVERSNFAADQRGQEIASAIRALAADPTFIARVMGDAK